jgi:sugar phosphate isomerase/epimerase
MYPQLLDDTVKAFAAYPVENIEIFLNTESELHPLYLRELKIALDNAGVKCAAVHPYTSVMETVMFFSPYERRVPDVLEYYRKYFNAMNILGASIFVFHGAKVNAGVSEQLYFDRYGRLLELAKIFGVKVAQENVGACMGHSVDFLVKLMSYFRDSAAFVLDVKQALRGNADVFELIDVLADRIVHVHISDSALGHDCLLPGEGTANLTGVLRGLKNAGFDGTVILEVYRDNFGDIEDLFDGYLALEHMVRIA